MEIFGVGLEVGVEDGVGETRVLFGEEIGGD